MVLRWAMIPKLFFPNTCLNLGPTASAKNATRFFHPTPIYFGYLVSWFPCQAQNKNLPEKPRWSPVLARWFRWALTWLRPPMAMAVIRSPSKGFGESVVLGRAGNKYPNVDFHLFVHRANPTKKDQQTEWWYGSDGYDAMDEAYFLLAKKTEFA